MITQNIMSRFLVQPQNALYNKRNVQYHDLLVLVRTWMPPVTHLGEQTS